MRNYICVAIYYMQVVLQGVELGSLFFCGVASHSWVFWQLASSGQAVSSKVSCVTSKDHYIKLTQWVFQKLDQ